MRLWINIGDGSAAVGTNRTRTALIVSQEANPMKIEGGIDEAKVQAQRTAKTTGMSMAIWRDGRDFYILPTKTRRRPTDMAEWVNEVGPHQTGYGRIRP